MRASDSAELARAFQQRLHRGEVSAADGVEQVGQDASSQVG
jgi:hypothetical protein